MYNPPGSEDVEDNFTTVMWVAAFGCLLLPPELLAWSKHPRTRKLDASWPEAKANLFLDQFKSMMTNYCITKWDARRQAQEEKEEKAAFAYDHDKWWARPGTDQQKLKHNELTQTLRHYIPYVCSDEIVASLRALFLQTESPETLTWKTITEKCLSGWVKPRTAKAVEDFTTYTRDDAASLSAWVAGMIIIRTQVISSGAQLPESMYAETLWEQVNHKERAFFADIPETTEQFQTSVAEIMSANRREELPRFRASDVAKAVSKRPRAPSFLASNSRPNNTVKKEVKRNSGNHLWQERCAICHKSSHATERCWQNKDNPKRNKRYCHICKKETDHATKACPHSSKVQAFLTRVAAAEEDTMQVFSTWTDVESKFLGLPLDNGTLTKTVDF